MFKYFAITLLLLVFFNNPLFANENLEQGESLLLENCYGCHGEDIYSRPERMIKSYSSLVQRVRFCSLQRNLAWFEEDIEDVAAYLNDEFYRFSH
ncbi:MAG: cytochrome c [Gammaproteobacteria bacterium]|nr:cytochrome c [Gammaproteobacteria bacterium]